MKKNIYNKFNTKEIWDKVCLHNRTLIEDYRNELISKKKSKGTILQYINDLKIFACYVYEKLDNRPFYNLTRKHIRNFTIDMQDREMSSARINRILSSIRTLFDYATDDEDYEDEYPRNVASKIRGVKGEKVRDIEFLTREEVDALYDRLVRDGNYQQALLLALLMDSACRKNEAYQIKKTSITEDGMFTNEVVGKGGKRFELMYHQMTKNAFKLYIQQRGHDDKDFLWYKKNISGEIEPLGSDIFYSWIKKWNKYLEEETGVKKNFNIHSFRHSALEQLSNGEHYLCTVMGVDRFSLDTLQILAHHNDISTTNSYLNLKDREKNKLKEAFSFDV